MADLGRHLQPATHQVLQSEPLLIPIESDAMLQGLTPAVLWQGFFYNRYEPPAESKGGPGTETGANKDQQVHLHSTFTTL